MSVFRVEKRREAAEITLTTGATLAGHFFLAASSPLHAGPERVGDLLNLEGGFFPFGTPGGDTALINRAYVVKVVLPEHVIEAQLDDANRSSALAYVYDIIIGLTYCHRSTVIGAETNRVSLSHRSRIHIVE